MFDRPTHIRRTIRAILWHVERRIGRGDVMFPPSEVAKLENAAGKHLAAALSRHGFRRVVDGSWSTGPDAMPVRLWPRALRVLAIGE